MAAVTVVAEMTAVTAAVTVTAAVVVAVVAAVVAAVMEMSAYRLPNLGRESQNKVEIEREIYKKK